MRIIFFAFFIITVLLAISCHEANDVSFPNYGFDFPKSVSSHDSNEFYYPLKDIFSSRDSILSYEVHYLYNAYDEENLSIGPAEVPTIRFIYEAMSYPVIIKLIPNAIIIKQGYKGWFLPEHAATKLTPTERLFFYSNQYRYDSSNLQTIRWRKWDSLIEVYPMFKDPAYYDYVLSKSALPITEPLKYHTKETRIPHSTYVSLIKTFNESGFWNAKVKIDCDKDWMDGAGFSLEANTGKKYNVVFREVGCSGNERKILSACQDLISLSGLKKEIKLYWKNETIQADTLSRSN